MPTVTPNPSANEPPQTPVASRRHAAWLLAELPQLQREQIVDVATAERLRAHYAVAADQDAGVAGGLTAVLGALLVGLGVVLLIAHNWDRWPQWLRVLMAALPLLSAQLACVYTLRRRAGSRIWCESVALLTALAAAALLALVAQIFHFNGELSAYLLSSVLLGLPLVYLFDARWLAALLAAAMVGVIGSELEPLRQPWYALLLYALLLPYLQQRWRREPGTLSLSLLLSVWLLGLLLALTLAIAGLRDYGWLWCALLAALLLMVDGLARALRTLPLRPLRASGELLWAIVVLAASFPEFWSDSGLLSAQASLLNANVVVLTALLLVIVLWALALWRRQWLLAAMVVPVLLLVLRQTPSLNAAAMPLAALSNLYGLAIGVAMIVAGLRTAQLRMMSSGLTLLAALVLLRFFGSEWPFVVRGLAFVGVGLGFLLAHAWLRRRLRAARASA